MTKTVNIVRILVGILFIFSGLVKANDPLSLSYKMQEFFEIWTGSLEKGSFFMNHMLINLFHFLNGHSLTLSVLMIAFEIIAGAALLLGWKMKIFSWLLLLLILFFTFLTGYALLSGKFKNCGCFGDCLPITPKASFYKDLALTAMIFYLFFRRKWIQPYFSAMPSLLSMIGVTIFSFGIQFYALAYLPFADCLPYKKGNNILEKMKIPAGARPDSFAIRFVYEKDGKQFEFSPAELPSDLATYKFVSRVDKLIRKGNAEPPIKGFSLSGLSDEDSTEIILNQPYSIFLLCENFNSSISRWQKGFSGLYKEAKSRNIPVYIVTGTPNDALNAIKGTDFADISIMKCDYKAIETAARTNPCLMLLKQGTIQHKWSWRRMGSAEDAIKKIPAQTAN